MLVVSVIKEIPDTRGQVALRSFYIIPGMVISGYMVSIGMNITMPTTTIKTSIINGTTGAFITNSTTIQEGANVLLQPVWPYIHSMLFITFLIYIFAQVLIFMEKRV